MSNQLKQTIMNVFEYAAMMEYNWKMNLCGYEPISTFYNDFSIADVCGGIPAVKDTYKRAFQSWKSNYKMITEFVMVLNHKIWEHYNNGHHALAIVYDALWKECDAWCLQNLKGDELSYYVRTLD